MKKNLAHFFHRRRLQALPLYADGELPPNEQEETRRHLAGCAICSAALTELQTCRALLQAGAPSPLVPTQRMWQRLVRATASAPFARNDKRTVLAFLRPPPLRWAALALTVIFMGALVWRNGNPIKPNSRAEQAQLAAVIDYGMFFDALRREAAPTNFYKRYPAQIVQLAEAQQAVDFPLAEIAALPSDFQFECVRVLECSGVKCVQFSYSKDGKALNLFQHELGQAWTLGQYAVARAPICNVECLLVNAKELTAVSWQGKHSEYLAVGQLPPQEFARIVQVLR